ncbi:BRO family protein [Novacetimonas hansenii]|uniref:BRO family protein n=1 Tax=Novacetimonas hansenii TaxID=436 RepID=UPI00094F5933|nr:BRO family protein [Novacetimonas hansenii]
MTQNIIPFAFKGHEIRTIMVDGEPAFVGKDVCERLGYADPTNAMKLHCRGVVKRHPIVDALGRTQNARIIFEPDVLRLIIKSKLPEAEEFERWVFEEVLPSIRKTGSYSVKPVIPQTYAEALLEAGRLAQERDALKAENLELAPKAAGLAILADKDGELGIRDAGRELKVGQNRVRDMLFERKWACRQGREIKPASYGLGHGYVRLVPRLYEDKQTGQEKISDDFRITRKGIARLAEIFGSMGTGGTTVPFAKAKETAPA